MVVTQLFSSPSTISFPIPPSRPTEEMTHPTAGASKSNEELKLSDYFNVKEPQQISTDIDCQAISNILQQTGNVSVKRAIAEVRD
jgi:hypothetical protein